MTIPAALVIVLLFVALRLVPALRQWDVFWCRHSITRPKQLSDGRLALVCWSCNAHTPGSEPLAPDPRIAQRAI